MNFENSTHLSCFFGRVRTIAIFVDSTHVRCSTPSAALVNGVNSPLLTGASQRAVVNVSVSNNGLDTSLVTAEFSFEKLPVVSSASPKFGYITGGTPVLLVGSNFVRSAGLSCRFGSEPLVEAVFVSKTMISCTAPKIVFSGAYLISASNNRVDFSTSSVTFHYLVPPSVTAIMPSVGSILGGTSVLVTGSNFAKGGNTLLCKFGDLVPVGIFCR